MSMLAERKRKQKWSLNPRGKHWAEDTNKYGQKLMEKMGWTSGKGLGAKENGITEHIKISYKNDSKGMGYKESNDQWTEHESNFSALLESLTGEEADISKVEKVETSLEKKSQSSRVRVHYHKFTRGKDLSRYSEKDLANIFGKKSLKDKKKTDGVEQADDKTEAAPENSFLINGGSITDYFKKKLPSFGKTNGFVVGNNGVLQKAESESESEERVGFGFKSNKDQQETTSTFSFYPQKQVKKESFVSYINNEDEEDKGAKKRKIEDSDLETPRKRSKLEPQEETPKGKKKKKSKKADDEGGVSNPGFDPLYTQVNVEKHQLNPIVETEELEQSVTEQQSEDVMDEEGTKKKKKKNKNNSEISEVESCESNDADGAKKKKKKNKNNSNIDSNGLDDGSNEQDTCEVTKKKKKKNKNAGIDNSAFDEISNEAETQDNCETTKKKKKKNKNNGGFDNSAFNDVSAESPIETENPYEVKPKNKKKKKHLVEEGLDNPNLQLDDSLDGGPVVENPYEVKPKKTKTQPELNETPKKKKKNKDDSLAIDNPNFNANDSVGEVTQEENPFEVKPKKKKKKKDKENIEVEETAKNETEAIKENLPMPECDLMLNIVTTPIIKTPSSTPRNIVRRRKSVRFSDVNEERIIPNKEDIQMMTERNELFDINTQVITNGMEEGARNGTFDMSSIDKVSFTEPTIKPTKKRKRGLENEAFDEQKNQIEENVDSIAKTLDRYQAEIENDINEAKMKNQVKPVELSDVFVGEVASSISTHVKTEEGTKLKFAGIRFNKSLPYFENAVGPKKSYKHLIKGDITVAFKNTNLHKIKGYATSKNVSV